MDGYRADRAFDGETWLPGGALVLVEDGVIVGVEPGTAPAPAGCAVTHLPGTTLLPGLIDCHTHLCGNSAPDALDRLPGLGADELDKTIEAALAAHLAAGVTTVRDLGDQDWAVVDRHRNPDRGPTVVAAGPPITSVDGHCAAMGGAVAGVDELRRAVRDRAERGADVVKIMATGGVLTPSTDIRACQLTLAELRAAVEEAHRLGLPVTAHAHALAGVQMCGEAGVDGIEHSSCTGTDGGMHTPPELAAAIASAGILVCPTLGYDFEVLGDRWEELVRQSGFSLDARLAQVAELYQGGVALVSGVDSGVHTVKAHGKLAFAVSDLVACGVPTTVALASATSLAARACGLADRTGRLRAGLAADLILVDGDPAADITALREVRAVVVRGRT
jgi:imidazolonepropionase-like amidohydrolase